MKIASITPIKNVDKSFEGDYAMMLAHLAHYYPPKKDRNPNCYTIMDNSLIELGEAVGIEQVFKAAEKCEADEFVLPDVFMKGEDTVKKVKESIQWLKDHNVLTKHRLMAVVQGETYDELCECFKKLVELPEIHCIGIPKITSVLCENRAKLESIWQGCPKAVHLLGCWYSLSEIESYQNLSQIRSMDTCIPALLSQTGSDAFAMRPIETIDLIEDSIHEENYKEICSQLKARGWL